ncbi:hypothetical protein RJZ57_002068 [Blastomyces gilchristii]
MVPTVYEVHAKMTLDDLQGHRGLELLAVPDRLGDSIKPVVRYHIASNRAATAMYTPGGPYHREGEGERIATVPNGRPIEIPAVTSEGSSGCGWRSTAK